MKDNKGITLIALVITIIVLLILAGVAIAMLSGENGLLNRASDSKIVNLIGAKKDEASIAASEGITNYFEKKYVTEDLTAGTTKKQIVKEALTPLATTTGPLTITVTDDEITIASTEKTSIKTVGEIQDNGTLKWTDTFKAAE